MFGVLLPVWVRWMPPRFVRRGFRAVPRSPQTPSPLLAVGFSVLQVLLCSPCALLTFLPFFAVCSLPSRCGFSMKQWDRRRQSAPTSRCGAQEDRGVGAVGAAAVGDVGALRCSHPWAVMASGLCSAARTPGAQGEGSALSAWVWDEARRAHGAPGTGQMRERCSSGWQRLQASRTVLSCKVQQGGVLLGRDQPSAPVSIPISRVNHPTSRASSALGMLLSALPCSSFLGPPLWGPPGQPLEAAAMALQQGHRALQMSPLCSIQTLLRVILGGLCTTQGMLIPSLRCCERETHRLARRKP